MVVADTSESKAEGGGGGVEPGEYHFMVEDVSAETNDVGTSLKVVASVLDGTIANQVGHKQTEFFQCSGKAVDRLRVLLVATNMMTDEQWVARIGQPLEFDERLLKGRQFCARIKLEKYQGKKAEHQGKSFPRMGFDIWSVWEEKAKHIPKDKECLAMLGAPPAGAGQQKTSVAPAQTQQTQPAQQSSSFSW